MFQFCYCLSVSGSLMVHLHFQGFFFLCSHRVGKTSPQTFPHPLHGITSVFSWFQRPRPEQNQQVSYISQQNHASKWFSADSRLCQLWPGRNRKSKRTCSFSVNSTFSLKGTWDQFWRGPLPLSSVTLPVVFYPDPDCGWLVLGRTAGISWALRKSSSWPGFWLMLMFAWRGWLPVLMAEKLGFHGETRVLDWTAFLSSSHPSSWIPNHILPAASFRWELQKSFSSRQSSWHVSSPGWLTFMAWRLMCWGQELWSGTQSAFCKTGKYWVE